ncbi:Holliday junction branch migration protein RuvA [Microbaculum marinum]|uniref:Holliday junction branch migration complex subunit RuvA n=1 Tax=Microbaculum marinum TaxID=1764581 RepID=A0AAW9RK19_9HYPH
MIGKLKGIVDSYGEDWVIVDVGGVGYMVTCSTRTLSALPGTGEPAVVFVETVMREDAIRLYGFASEAEKQWFRLLQSVQGVGARVALAVLGTLSAADLGNAVAMQDKAMVARAPGVGPKVAQRIVSELRDKSPIVGGDVAFAKVSGEVSEGRAASPARDAVSALVNLGYAQAQAGAAVAAALKGAGEEATAETLIRLGLKELAR